MTVSEIILGGGIGLIVLFSLIEITPLKLNPWKAIGKAIGKAINGEVLEKVNNMQTDITNIKADFNKFKDDVDAVKSNLDIIQSDVIKLTSELDDVKCNVNAIDAKVEQTDIIACRADILCFADEIFHGLGLRTMEYYKHMLMNIDKYEAYCEKFPEFENSITLISVQKIKDEYAHRLETNDFIK